MGYKKYAKDYEIEYRDRIGRRKPEAVRIYVGPYFKFDVSPEEIKKLKITCCGYFTSCSDVCRLRGYKSNVCSASRGDCVDTLAFGCMLCLAPLDGEGKGRARTL